ncbi:GNAT family N-acetyltransferase [Paenibacillus sp. 481]|uniref:GNAT family N-acetyltransferase n=1 Tax=Paenibacillus sp. 481 TaxID=2835869 RepID=UPI001E5C754A|nr:GNAT family N-acetyltransferase [Paenibacillus sp. 481]UHA75137.1 GNAT family N-acetyltransferase [Paenibacillus sp. 481]
MNIIETERLIIRELTTDDAEFIVELLNTPSWLQYIGDKGVRTIADAHGYILNGPVEMYARLGFGLYLTELKENGTPIGICGLIKRDTLDDTDIGYAFLPEYWGQGYAYEAGSATIDYGTNVLGLSRILGITSPDNYRSANLLKKLGMQFEGMVKLSGDAEEIGLYAFDVQ